MKVCIFTKSLLKGGAEKQSILLASALAKNHEVVLIVWNGERKNHYKTEINNAEYFTYLLKGNCISKMIYFYKILKVYEIDVLFSYLLTTNIVSALIGNIARIKFIVGGIRNVYHPKLKEILMKLVHNYVTDFTVTNCVSSLNLLKRKGFKSEKLIVIPNGIELREIFITKIFQSETVILTVARFVTQKDYATAVKAINYLHYHLLHSSEFHVKYIIVGYGALKNEIENEISKRGLEETIIIEDDSNLENLYIHSDIYLCTSLYEGVSNSILEAMNYSLPIVATNAGDNKYLVENSKNGFICDVKDWRGIANALYVLVRYPEYRMRMGRESYKHLEENYSLRIFEKRYSNLLSSMENQTLEKSMIPNIDSTNLIYK